MSDTYYFFSQKKKKKENSSFPKSTIGLKFGWPVDQMSLEFLEDGGWMDGCFC